MVKRSYYEIQLTANSCIALCSSKNTVNYSQVYGTRKNFPVYGSFTTDPDAKPVTSTYFPSSGV